MKFRNVISVIGLLIPISFVISYAILFAIHPVALQSLTKLSIFGYNIEGLPHLTWIRWMNYFLNGLLIMLFSIGLIALNSKYLTNNIGFVSSFLSGLFWCLLCFFPSSYDTKASVSDFMLLSMLAVPIFSAFGFVFMSFEMRRLIAVNFLKKLMLVVAVVIFLLTVIGFINVESMFIMSSISAMMCVILYGVLGYYLRDTNQKS